MGSTNDVVRNSWIAGSCAGVLSTALLYPMEYMRVQLQQHEHRTIYQILQKAVRSPTILYTGVSLPLAAQMVYKATVFSVTTRTEQSILHIKGTNDLSRMDRFYSGCVGGAVNAGLFVTPVEFVRNQLIAKQSSVSEGKPNTIRNVVRHHLQTGGIQSLWRGVGITVVRDAIGCGAFFYTVHMLQEGLAATTELSSLARTMISGAVGGVMFWVVALPMDTVKTWIQSSSDAPSSPRTELYRLYRELGSVGVAQRLLRGWQVAYTRAMPSAALTMATYTTVYEFLDKV